MHTEDERDLRIIDELVDNLYTREEENVDELFAISVSFNFDHMDMIGKKVKVILNNNDEVIGTFIKTNNNAATINIDDKTISINDIVSMELI